jgi:Na+/H+ antiporter NhaD/arsenite permease-like protein
VTGWLPWAAIAVFTVAYLLIATEWIHRVAAALGGAGVMLALGITDAEAAFFTEESGVDWNVVFLLLGMMIIVGVLRQTGIFEYVAIWAVRRASGRPFRVMVILIVLTAGASTLLDNVTTVLLIAPVTLLVCERLDVPVAPFLIAEALASNIGGTATLVGDPPNIIIGSRGGLSFNDFLSVLAPLIIGLTVVFIGLCRVLFRRAFTYRPERADAVTGLSEREAITDPRLLVKSLVVLTAVVLAFALHTVLHLEPSVVALLGAGVLLAVSRLPMDDALAEVEWSTLAFFMGLFVMVGGLVHTGVIERLSEAAAAATEGRLLATSMVLLWASAAISAIVDNIPYVATMSPVVAELVEAAHGNSGGTDPNVLWWSLALGADLGGNATAVGASANVVIVGIAERSGHRISFWEFTKYGLVVAVTTVALSAPYLYLRFFVFG